MEDTDGFRSVDAPAERVPFLPDPGFLWQVFRRNIWIFLGAIVLTLAAAVAYLMTVTPMYRASASLLIEPAADPVRTSGPNEKGLIPNADEIDTELRLVDSPIIGEIAAGLYADRFASPDGDEFTETEIVALGSRINSATAVGRAGTSKVLSIVGVSSDPVFAAAAANLRGEAYLQSQVNAKTSQSDSTQAIIAQRIEELEQNSIDALTALDNYKASRGLITANGGSNADQEVSTLNQQLAQARASLAEQQGRLNAARAQLAQGGGGANVSAALGSGVVSSLRSQEANVSARLAVLAQKYGELHPTRVQAQKELDEIQLRIQQEINRVISNLQAEVDVAQSRVNSLAASRQRALGTLTANSRAQAGLRELQQKATAASQIYQSFLARSQENVALRDSAMPDASFASRAKVPTAPFSPNAPLIIGAALAAGVVLGFGGLLAAEYLRRGIQTKRDVEKRLRLRYAGAIPTLSSTIDGKAPLEGPADYVVTHPQSLFAESFRSIRTFLTLSQGKRPRAIAIASALPREGKTTTSVCLSRATALEGIKTILVDADLRRRGTSELFEFDAEYDIHDYLFGRAPLDACLHHDEVTGLDVLGSKDAVVSPKNPLTEDRIARMLDELRDRYDVVVLDTAPILGIAEGRVLAAAADRVLLLTHWKKTSMRAVEAVIDMLLESGAKVTGMALTQVNIKRYASTGDGDVYAYSKKFRGYYTN
ncbi:MAG: polysaccharide biosynthesis tyrosine autokinase [Pseudomonadota bacterium]